MLAACMIQRQHFAGSLIQECDAMPTELLRPIPLGAMPTRLCACCDCDAMLPRDFLHVAGVLYTRSSRSLLLSAMGAAQCTLLWNWLSHHKT